MNNRKIAYLLSLILLLFASTVFASGEPEIIIKKGKLTINDVKINPDWLLTNAKIVLKGTPRIRAGYNITHTYDELGIVFFEPTLNKQGSGIINEFQIHFSDIEKNEVTPANTSNATVVIDKLKVSRNLTKDEMLKKLSSWARSEAYLEHSYRLNKGDIYIYFLFSNDEQYLRKVSIGRDTKK